MNYSARFPAWHICKCLISFEWITVRLSGLGPKTRQASAFWGQSLMGVMRLNGGRMLTKRERRRGRRPFLLCSVVKMFYSTEQRSVLFRRLEYPACRRSGNQDYIVVVA